MILLQVGLAQEFNELYRVAMSAKVIVVLMGFHSKTSTCHPHLRVLSGCRKTAEKVGVVASISHISTAPLLIIQFYVIEFIIELFKRFPVTNFILKLADLTGAHLHAG